ncbi:hypothetical protein Q0F98_25940 [Paenibacillus amylolyticus]|nr:hypothetical protein Q0F98_25940 [Paenibacillus amylolyticus]
MMNWGINHIGTKPFFIFIGGAVFAIFFWIRSQKIAEDLSQLGAEQRNLHWATILEELMFSVVVNYDKLLPI